MIATTLHTQIKDAILKGADWLARHQHLQQKTQSIQEFSHYTANYGAFYNPCEKGDWLATQWMNSFTLMALEASNSFCGNKYQINIEAGISYLKTLQNLAPGKPETYGLVAEFTPNCSWCFVRDSVSAAWCYLAFYKKTNDPEYLERALAFFKWFMKYGLDEEGFPYSGALIHPKGNTKGQLDLLNHLQGSYHGGTLNLFYQLYQCIQDKNILGDEYQNFINLFIKKNITSDGNFIIFNKDLKGPEQADAHANLHKINDDFTTIGFLTAYQLDPQQKYLDIIYKYLDWVVSVMENGLVTGHQSGVPVILNLCCELKQINLLPERFQSLIETSCLQLINIQNTSNDMEKSGGFMESSEASFPDRRTSAYAVIALNKVIENDKRYLGLSEMN